MPSLLQNNITNLQNILNTVNNLPDGGDTVKAPGIIIETETGSIVNISKNNITKTCEGISGFWIFSDLVTGEWTVSCTKDTLTVNETIIVEDEKISYIKINFNKIPTFTYTGNYEIVNDNDEYIDTSITNWKIRFLTSGTLTFTELKGAEDGIDVFLVGGGAGGASSTEYYYCGGGGGGGYTATHKNVPVVANTEFQIVIGSGGSPNNVGGNTSAFSFTASGGYPGTSSDSKNINGGDGGSGGGSGWGSFGGTNGSNGVNYDSNHAGGKGQISKPGPNGETGNTCEFGEYGATIYSNGGESSAVSAICYQAENTGNGGRGDGVQQVSAITAEYGSSGIVIIRNARGV